MRLEKFKYYLQLMRFNRPEGTYLLLWPVLTALWIAGQQHPPLSLVLVFIVGVFIMRAAGGIINDVWDKNFDVAVERTKKRPIADEKILRKEAIILFVGLGLVALCLAFTLNTFSIVLALVGAALTILYPLLKRFFPIPQLGLGIVWSFGILIAFSASMNALPFVAWLLFAINLILTVAYDTMYAMSDRPDDLQIGVHSAAIFFGKYDRIIVAGLQLVVLTLLILVGVLQNYSEFYYFAVFVGASCFAYQQFLIRDYDRDNCLKAFLNNHWFTQIIFLGVLAQSALK